MNSPACLLAAGLSFLLALPAAALLELVPDGEALDLALNASGPALASNARGETALAWSDGADVFVQLRDAEGRQRGETLVIDQGRQVREAAPALTLDGAGGLVVAWISRAEPPGAPPAPEVLVQRFDRQGRPAGPPELAFTEVAFSPPALALAPGGGFAVLSVGRTGLGTDGVFLRRFDGRGEPLGEAQLLRDSLSNPYIGFLGPRAAYNPEGELLTAWQRFECGLESCFGFQIEARRFRADGQPLGGIRQVTDRGAGFDLDWHPSGRFLFVWNQPEPNDFPYVGDPPAFAVLARTFSDSGPGPQLALTDQAGGLLVSAGAPPEVAVDPLGNTLALWQDSPVQGPASVLGRFLDQDLQFEAEAFEVPALEGHQSFSPAVATEAAGRFFVAWTAAPESGARRLRGQRFRLAGDGCLPSSDRLCLGGRRWQLTGTYTTRGGATGPVRFVSLADDSAYGWMFRQGNPEMLLKLLDGEGVNGFRWFFFGGLTNVHLELVLEDVTTGAVKRYEVPAGAPSSFADLRALPAGEGGDNLPGPVRFPEAEGPSGIAIPPQPPSTAPSADISPCEASTTVLCFLDGRFAVEAWRVLEGGNDPIFDPARAIALTPTGGTFFFARPGNLELIVKMVDGRAVNGHFWIFHGAASNQLYRLLVTDTETGATWSYDNPRGELASGFDTRAFEAPTGREPR